MDPITIGTLLSGVGSVFGAFGQKKTNYKRQTADSLEGTVTKARELGLHPLAALGHPVGSPENTVNVGDRIAQAGEAISRGAQGKMAGRIAESEIQMNEAQRKLIEAQTATIKMEAARALQGGPKGPINFGDPEETTEDVPGLNKIKFPWGNITLPVGPDLDQIITGIGAGAGAGIGAGVQTLDTAIKKWAAGVENIADAPRKGRAHRQSLQERFEAKIGRKLTEQELKQGYYYKDNRRIALPKGVGQ